MDWPAIGFGWVPKLLTQFLNSPIFAALVFTLDRHYERVAMRAAPPFCGIQSSLALQWFTAVPPKFCLPFFAR